MPEVNLPRAGRDLAIVLSMTQGREHNIEQPIQHNPLFYPVRLRACSDLYLLKYTPSRKPLRILTRYLYQLLTRSSLTAGKVFINCSPKISTNRSRDCCLLPIAITNSTMVFSLLLELPAELRVRVYEFVLPAATPLRNNIHAPSLGRGRFQVDDNREPQKAQNFKEATLLHVSRVVYQEALPILYKVNTIAISKAILCSRGPPGPMAALKQENLVHVHISDFTVSQACQHEIVDGLPPCKSCDQTAVGMFKTMAAMPHLRTVDIEHGRNPASRCWFQRFKPALRRKTDHALRLTCLGVGQYGLSGESVRNIRITFKHSALVALWAGIVRPKEGTPGSGSSYGEHATRRFAATYDDTAKQLRDLTLFHAPSDYGFHASSDYGKIPPGIANVWPRDVSVDIRNLAAVKTPGFLEHFDDAVEAYLQASHSENWRTPQVAKW